MSLSLGAVGISSCRAAVRPLYRRKIIGQDTVELPAGRDECLLRGVELRGRADLGDLVHRHHELVDQLVEGLCAGIHSAGYRIPRRLQLCALLCHVGGIEPSAPEISVRDLIGPRAANLYSIE